MAMNTDIEWTGVTHNPVTGCDRMSPGCDHCYACPLAKRLQGMERGLLARALQTGHAPPVMRYQRDGDPRTSGPGFGVTCHWDKINEPLGWKQPRTIFVNSMSDLFHREVPEAFLQAYFAMMHQAHWHTFQILTKRSKRLRHLASALRWAPHIWMGVSVEMVRYFYRIHDLATTPAHVKFLSLEPLLEPLPGLPLAGIDWVIIGGESSSEARPLDLAWVRDILAQCQAAQVACFVKQLGTVWAKAHGDTTRKGGEMAAWPADLRVRQFPSPEARLPLPLDIVTRIGVTF